MQQAASNKTVGSPRPEWKTMQPQWRRSRAIIGGLGAAREHDTRLTFDGNLLIPFSATMSPEQYAVLRSEAELPCITAQFAKILVESLLRKRPTLNITSQPTLNSWLLDSFGPDGMPIEADLSAAAQEELTSGACWVFVDHPTFTEAEFDALTPEDQKKVRPYVIVRRAEEVINWHYNQDKLGRRQLQFVVVRAYEDVYKQGEVHPTTHEMVYIHRLNESGKYEVQKWKGPQKDETPTENGIAKAPANESPEGGGYTLEDTIPVLIKNEPMDYIPAWPLSGATTLTPPPLMALVEKEVSLYNKMTRRNHLLFNCATFTPYVSGDMTEEEFGKVVKAGLGSWLKIPAGATLEALSVPSDALSDYDRSIAAAIEEIAKLGVRMMAPDSAQSGVALEIRNAAQTAQLGTLNMQISNTWKQVLQCMIHWYTGEKIELDKIEFKLASDYLSALRDSNAMRLITEWYENGHIPRSVFLHILRTNDFLPDGYDDEKGKAEITEDTNFKDKPSLED